MITQTETHWGERNDPLGLRLARLFGAVNGMFVNRYPMSTERSVDGEKRRLNNTRNNTSQTIAIEAQPNLRGGFNLFKIDRAHIDSPGDYYDLHSYRSLGHFSPEGARRVIEAFIQTGTPLHVHEDIWTDGANQGLRRQHVLEQLDIPFYATV